MKQAGFSPSAAIRNRIYVALASIFFLLAVGLGIGKAKLLHQPFNLVVSDDRYYYAYLPSVVNNGNYEVGYSSNIFQINYVS
jgi:Mg2+/citrate symporter